MANFTSSAIAQRQFTLNTENTNYIRNWTLTQDTLFFNFQTASVAFPLYSLAAIAVSVNSQLAWPPSIIIQPTSSYVTHPTSSYFMVSASAANGSSLTYQWYSQSLSQSIFTSSIVFYPLTNSLQGYGGVTTNFLTHYTSSITDASSSYYCQLNGVNGSVSSSIAQLYVY